MSGVRLSFALSYWRDLGDIYPPAKQAMLEIRDRNTLQLEQGQGNPALFHDVVGLNRTLGENAKTVQLFREIDKTNDAFAGRCWHYARNVIFSEKQYDLAGKYIKDQLREFDRVKAMYHLKLSPPSNSRPVGQKLKQVHEEHFIEDCLQLIELATANGDKKTAKEIRKRATSVVGRPIGGAKDSNASSAANSEAILPEAATTR